MPHTDAIAEPLVHVRALVRFMVYGEVPAELSEIDVWILRVPAAWVHGAEPGAPARALTELCSHAVSRQYEAWRIEALKGAYEAAADGSPFDGGHYWLEGRSVTLLDPSTYERRPWTTESHRFFYVVDDKGTMRPGTEADAPVLAPLTPIQEHAFAAWRAEEVGAWKQAAQEYERALWLAGQDPDPVLMAEVEAGLVRATAGLASTLAPARSSDDDLIRANRGHRFLTLASGPDIQALQAALETQPVGFGLVSQEWTLFNLALALEHEGRLDEAQGYLRSALVVQLQQGPGGAAAVLQTELALARVLARQGPGHATEARALLESTGPRVKPGSVGQALHLWATALLDHAITGDAQRALAVIDSAVPMAHYDAAYEGWIAADRAKLAADSGR